VKAFSGIEHSAFLKLDRLEAAAELKDLAALPGNHFEALKGDRKGQYSIRVNSNGGCASSGPQDRPGLKRSRSLTIARRLGTPNEAGS
jgi:toxin HigB-1